MNGLETTGASCGAGPDRPSAWRDCVTGGLSWRGTVSIAAISGCWTNVSGLKRLPPAITHEVNHCLSLMMYYKASNGKRVFNACFSRLHG